MGKQICELCRAEVGIICFWFTDNESEKEYLQAIEDNDIDRQEDFLGELVSFNSLPEGLQGLAGRRIGYFYHMDRRGKTKPCEMSHKMPRNEITLGMILKKVRHEIENPPVKIKTEDEIAHKRSGQRGEQHRLPKKTA